MRLPNWLWALPLLGALGCGPTCNKQGIDGQEVEFRGGTTSADGTAYATGDWCDPWLHLPNGRTFRLIHGLGVAPEPTAIFVAFEERPFGDDCEGRGFTALPAGNIVVIENVNDEYIQVRNDTCEPNFFFRLVATTTGATENADDAGASEPGSIEPGTVALP